MKKVFSKFIMGMMMAMPLFLNSCTKDEVETTGTIYGIINDDINGEPISGANVALLPGGKSTNTGSDGSFEFGNMEPGQYTIQIKKSGYKTGSKSISVVPGETASGSLLLKKGESNIQLSAESINFGNQLTSLSFKIMNIGTSGEVKWNISDINADWLSVSPSSGSTAQGKESAVTVKVDRSKLKATSSTSFIINGDGESISFIVSAEVGTADGGSGDGDPSTPTNENIISCDNGIQIKILNCKRNINTLELKYTMTNTGMGKDLNGFYLHPNNPANQNVFSDNMGNSYVPNGNNDTRVKLTLGGKTSTNEVINVTLPLDNPVQGTITINDFSKEATSVNAKMYCSVSPSAGVTLASNWITFKSIEIE